MVLVEDTLLAKPCCMDTPQSRHVGSCAKAGGGNQNDTNSQGDHAARSHCALFCPQVVSHAPLRRSFMIGLGSL
jgi:hypothetical protein